jgi:hypothetical protein
MRFREAADEPCFIEQTVGLMVVELVFL